MRMLIVFAAFGVAAVVWAVWAFNRLVSARNAQREAWSGIDVQLKRRHDVLPLLVACVEGYRAHEAGLLQRIAALRSGPWNAAEENTLAREVRSVIGVAENYPALKADANYRDLMASLVEVEDQLQYARRYYNGTVRDLNNLIQSIPNNIVAQVFGFVPAAFFEVESAVERAVPEVKT